MKENQGTVYVILGPSGSGKDTQAELMSKEFGDIPMISTGQMFREIAEKKTEDGLKVAAFMQKGVWVPDELTLKILREYLERFDLSKGIIFNGFPRTHSQCELLEQLLKECDLRIKKVFHLDTRDEVILKRIENRVQRDIERSGKRRQDDAPDIINQRLRSYKETITPILGYYEDKGILVHIDNERPVEEVFAQIREHI